MNEREATLQLIDDRIAKLKENGTDKDVQMVFTTLDVLLERILDGSAVWKKSEKIRT